MKKLLTLLIIGTFNFLPIQTTIAPIKTLEKNFESLTPKILHEESEIANSHNLKELTRAMSFNCMLLVNTPEEDVVLEENFLRSLDTLSKALSNVFNDILHCKNLSETEKLKYFKYLYFDTATKAMYHENMITEGSIVNTNMRTIGCTPEQITKGYYYWGLYLVQFFKLAEHYLNTLTNAKEEPMLQPITKIKKGIYQHYKGNYYELVDVARCSETLKEFVVYRALYGDFGLWVRPLTMFMENIEHNSATMPRFAFISSQNAQEFCANQKI